MMFLFNWSEYVVPWVGVLNQPGVWFFSRPSPPKKKIYSLKIKGWKLNLSFFFLTPFKRGRNSSIFWGRKIPHLLSQDVSTSHLQSMRSQQVDQGTRFHALYYGEPSPQRFSEASGHKRPRVWSLRGRDIRGPYNDLPKKNTPED